MVAEQEILIEKMPDPKCQKCGGHGSRFVPPLQEQLAEKERGERQHVTKRVCDCQLVREGK